MITALLRSHRATTTAASTTAFVLATASSSSKKSFSSMSFYDLSATTGAGTEQKMSDFAGKVVYATNVASQ